MKIATDHGFPKPSFGGSDPNAFDAFKNERDYIAQGGRMKSTVAAMEWAVGEIERLRADRAKVYVWMREPDWTEEASLSWVMDWINRRPTDACHDEQAAPAKES